MSYQNKQYRGFMECKDSVSCNNSSKKNDDVKGGLLFSLSDHSEKDKKWDYAKSNAKKIADFLPHSVPISDGFHSRFMKWSERLHDCANTLQFKQHFDVNTGEVGKFKLDRAFFCHARNCPVCDWRKSLMRSAMFFQKLPEIEKTYPSARWILVTLTVPNCPIGDLRSTLGAMSKAWQRLVNRKEVAKNMLGFVRSTEVTKEEKRNGYAHPHYHALILMKSTYFSVGYIKQARWTELWMQAMRSNEFLSVNVQAVKGNGSAGAVEVLKAFNYSIKTDQVLLDDPDWLIDYYKQTDALRFTNSGGVLKDVFVKVDNATDDDLIHTGEEELESLEPDYLSMIFTYFETRGKYYSRG